MIAMEAMSRNGMATFQALTDINLSVRKGEKIVLCGPSGSGKSTLIRCINHLETYQKGEIVVDGIAADDNAKTIDAVRREVGMVFQQLQPVPAYDGAAELHAGADAVARRQQGGGRGHRAALLDRVQDPRTRPTNIRPSSPAASSSASPSRAPCAWSPR